MFRELLTLCTRAAALQLHATTCADFLNLIRANLEEYSIKNIKVNFVRNTKEGNTEFGNTFNEI